jgi:phage tail-like protein
MALTFPINALPADRDPLRNFVFRVNFVGGGTGIATSFAQMGFISVSGQGIQTEMIPYREGGDNTITRKMPGQSDVGPLQLIRGVFINANASPQYNWMRRVFSVQWGKGGTGWSGNFRCDMIVRVIKHPVTYWNKDDYGDPRGPKAAGMLTRYYNCWPGAIQWNDLNAGDNSVMVETMTVHHEGFSVYYGTNAQGTNAGVDSARDAVR